MTAAMDARPTTFTGFPQATVKFLRTLERNNNREWFQQHKEDYKLFLEEPAAAFLDALIAGFESGIGGGPYAGKVFRIYRDVRFSKDKTPYNPYIHILVREAKPAKGTVPEAGFFFAFEPGRIMAGIGFMQCASTSLDRYRNRLDRRQMASPFAEVEIGVDDGKGAALEKIIASVCRKDGFRIDEPELKRVPAGFDREHPRGQLLRRKSLLLWFESGHDDKLFGSGCVKYLVGKYKMLMPLYQWIKTM